MNLTKIGAIYS